MKRKKISRFLAIGLCGVVLAGCSSNGENTADTSATESEEIQSKDTSSSESSPAVSEATSDSESEDEDNREYYKELAVLGEYEKEVNPIALENLDLPGIHENTIIYNGTVKPGNSVRFDFPNVETGDSRGTIEPEVSEEGNFSLSFSNQELNADDKIRLYISGEGMPHEQAFDLPVHPAEDGKEVIKSNADTQELEEALLEEISLPDIYPNTRVYDGETSGDVEAVHYKGSEMQLSPNIVMKFADKNTEGEMFTVFDKSLEVGQSVDFYIVANGITATIEKEVQDLSEEEKQAVETIEKETDLPDIHANTENYKGKTIANAEITIVNPDLASKIVYPKSDENGEFSLSLNENDGMAEEGGSLLFRIIDEKGNTATIEKKIVEE